MTIRWLHISDTHFREDELWDRRATLRALIGKVGELKAKGLAPDMVFVTGDIAWSGKPKEYEQATRFFHELNKVLELDPKDRWFLVPGNHDVDRSRITRSHRAIQAGLTDEAIVEETLRDPEAMRLLSTRLGAYYTFAAGFLGAARALQPDRPWRADVRELKGTSVGILQLNSAWVAEGGKIDEANLIVGEAQVREALDDTPDGFFRIALMHHPLRNLREFDANRIESLLGAKGGAAFLLRGHLHLNRTKVHSSPDGTLFELAAGTLYTEETNWPRGFHLGEVDLDKGMARIYLFRYSDEGSGFFAPDNLTYQNSPNGICKIKLPYIYHPGIKKTKPSNAVSETQRISFTARYRAAAANYHGLARFIGFPNQAARPNASVSDLFVPLRLKPRGSTSETESRTTAEIAERLLGGPAVRLMHTVVLGDPGSGKTTLSRFLVMLAAGAIAMPGVKVAGEPLPLRVAFRDFVERRSENPNLSLLDYLEFQARTELSLPLPKNFLNKAIENGEAILILDGLDEVGAPEHRVAMRDLVAGFAAAYGRLPMLVTSRIAGFDDAPLSEQTFVVEDFHVFVSFSVFVLDKFDDNDLRTFVSNWYSVQEPADPVARDRGVVDLLAAMDADERVRELARTPILATLIAMIHRVEANLPGERAKLYELCVRMLIETWPAQAKRPFAEIDPGLQRAYLESLAFEMQLRRENDAESITITRNDIIATLVRILRRRDFASKPEEKVGGVVEHWIDHLEKHSGILVEQSIGVYSFFHLSIMEYLAAQGIERELGRPAAVATIADHFSDAPWQEVCLLTVGSHASDAEFLDAVYDSIAESAIIERWNFLLRCIGEEARFRSEQRDRILDHYAATLLESRSWDMDLDLIEQIRHFSVRHAEAVQQWIDHRVDHALGDKLAATGVIAEKIDSLALWDRLANRRNQAEAAEALLEFWPGSSLGTWAARTIDAKSALSWSGQAPYDLAPIRAVAALVEPLESLAAVSLIGLNFRTVQLCSNAIENIANLSKFSNSGSLGMPAYITIEPGKMTLATTLRGPRGLSSRWTQVSPRFARALSSDYTKDFGREFAHHFSELVGGFAARFAAEFSVLFGTNSIRDFFAERATAGDLEGGPAHHEFALYCSGYFADHISDSFASEYAFDFTNSSGPDRSLMSLLRVGISEAESRCAARNMISTMVGEVWIAFSTMTTSENFDERLGYILFRLQNRWLFEIWSAIDQRLPENPSPAQLALYFALGWAQSTTTWAWPDSERWRTLFAAGPGEHWLVRSQWHLCKLTDDPASKDDDAGLRAALRDGHRDESLPGYAARLSEVLGIEG